MDKMFEILKSTWVLTALMAPSLLIGFAVASVLTLLVTPQMVYKHLGRSNFAQICKASILGVPLPLCSCSVLPVAASLRQYGAGRGSTIAFLTSTPQIGVSSIFVTWSMLGPLFTLIRCAAAFVSGVVCGSCVQLLPAEAEKAESGYDEKSVENETNCACDDESGNPERSSERFGRTALNEAVRYGFVTLPSDMGRSICMGLLISGLLAAFLPQNYFADKFIGNEFMSMLVMLVVGLSVYVCSSASVPLVLSLVAGGISPGAGLVFLIVGPATNAAAIVTIAKIVGRKVTFVYLVTLSLVALCSGYLLNRVVYHSDIAVGIHGSHNDLSWFSHFCALILLALLAQAFRKSE